MKQLAVVTFVVLVVAAACNKKADTGTTTAASSSAAETASGKCTLVVDKAKCLAGGKAAFCSMTKTPPLEVSWQTFTCPDCETTAKGGIKCSAYTVGEPCNMLTADDACSKDGKSEFQCDFETGKWKVTPCPGGCKGDMTRGMSCN